MVKTYYPEKMGIDPKSIFSVSVMPCTAKKAEAKRPQLCGDSGCPDVDVVITTRELARMIKEAGLDFVNLPEEKYDDPMGISSGAGLIFGSTGGVMEAALRTVFELVTGRELPGVDFKDVRGLEGLKEATIDLDGTKVKIAVCHTLMQAREMMERVKAGTADYHFIEVMACPGGCISGGGQPQPINEEIRKQRMGAMYEADAKMVLRKSHENPAIKELYDSWLGKPLGEKAHHLLHTHFGEQKGRLK